MAASFNLFPLATLGQVFIGVESGADVGGQVFPGMVVAEQASVPEQMTVQVQRVFDEHRGRRREEGNGGRGGWRRRTLAEETPIKIGRAHV